MIFSSIDFLIFFGVLLITLRLLNNYPENFKKVILLMASYFFYGYWDWRFLSIIIIVSIVNFMLGQKIHTALLCPQRKTWLVSSVIFNLTILAFFKYYNFFIDSIKVILPTINFPFANLDIILPIGISFFTFQVITYCVDIYKEKINPGKLLDVFLFVAFFPKLIVGPISTAAHFIPQLQNNILIKNENILCGFRLFLIGWVKKALLANSLTIYVDQVFNNITLYNSSTLVLAVIAYSFQIYFDFSGYSDMAIGTAKALGFDLPENFNYPYKAKNIAEFWRRWHMSLSAWIRDYIYIPLGGSRKGVVRTYINLFVTMMLCGLWHGAGFNFLFWGMLHGLALIVHRFFNIFITQLQAVHSVAFEKATPLSLLYDCVSVAGTYFIVCVGWIFFRAPNIDTAFLYIRRILSKPPGVNWVHISVYLIVPCFFLWHCMVHQKSIKERFIRLDTYLGMTISVALVTLILLFSPLGFSPFIYFQF